MAYLFQSHKLFSIYLLQVLTIAVLAVLLTAPLGAVAVTLLGPLLLEKSVLPESGEAAPEPLSEKRAPLEQELEGLVTLLCCGIHNYGSKMSFLPDL